jgi:hypothetical protein
MRKRVFPGRKKGLPPRLRILSVVALLAASMWLLTAMTNQAEAASQSDVLYGVNAADDGLSTIDPVSGEITFIGPLNPDPSLLTTPIAMAVRPSDGKIFVWNNSNGIGQNFERTGVLLTVDPFSGLATEVDPKTPNQGQLGALAFAPDGRLFGIDYFLYEIDTSTGKKTLIGSLGIRVGGADFDADGILYGVEFSYSSDRLVTINTNTGAATVVAELTENIGVIGSIVFAPDGTLIGSSFGPPLGHIMFDINPVNGVVYNIRTIGGGFPPQGMGFASQIKPIPSIIVPLDIKPGSCPNPLNVGSKGVIPVAVLGTNDFGVSDIDLASVRLIGVAPLRSAMEDVATPFEPFVGKEDSGDCNDYGPDGFEDLTLKFDTQQIVEALGDVQDGEEVVLTLTGLLKDGTEIKGEDILIILKKGKEKKGKE